MLEINLEPLELLMVTPILALFLASIVPLAIKVLRGNKEQPPFSVASWGFIGILTAALLTLVPESATYLTAFEGAVVFDAISKWSGFLVLLMGGAAMFLATENKATLGNQFSEFTFLLLNAIAGMLIVVWSNDLIITFIGIEVMSLCLYILIAMSREEKLSKEAAFKYFVLGSFASAIFLYGIAMIFGSVGSTYLYDVAEKAPQLMLSSPLFLMGSIMILVGLAFKVSIVPFHAWTPDVYQGAPTPVTALMATGVKVACFIALLRMTYSGVVSAELSDGLLKVMEWLAVLTMTVGNVAAILQNNFKRMLAYSSVAHSGYAFIGLIAASMGGDHFILGASSLIYYLVAYSIMTIGAFAAVSLLEKNETSEVLIDDLKGMGSSKPIAALCISIFMLSLAGIPPTIGFFGKFFIFSAAVKQGLFWLVVWAVLNSVISVYYYLRPIVVMYMKDEKGLQFQPERRLSTLALAVSAVLVVGLGIATSPLYETVVLSVRQIF